MTIPVGYGQINWIFDGQGVPNGAQVTLGFRNDADDTALAVAIAAHDAWTAFMLAEQSSVVTLEHTLVKLGPDATGPSAESGTPASGGVGSAGGDPTACFLVQKHTASGGRRNRGRAYIPGLWEGAYDAGGLLSSGVGGDVLAAWEDMIDVLVTADYIPVILHSGAQTPTVITGYSVSGMIATQRRRLRG